MAAKQYSDTGLSSLARVWGTCGWRHISREGKAWSLGHIPETKALTLRAANPGSSVHLQGAQSEEQGPPPCAAFPFPSPHQLQGLQVWANPGTFTLTPKQNKTTPGVSGPGGKEDSALSCTDAYSSVDPGPGLTLVAPPLPCTCLG